MARRQLPSSDLTPRAQGWMDLQIRQVNQWGRVATTSGQRLRASFKGEAVFGWHGVDVACKNLNMVHLLSFHPRKAKERE